MIAAGVLSIAERSFAAPPVGAGGGLFHLQPLSFSLTDLRTPSAAGAAAAAAAQGSFDRDLDWGATGSPFRIDVAFGAIVPFEDSGTAFGVDTSNENFDAGAYFGIRVQARLNRYFRLGGEIDFAGHDVEQGDVFFPGSMGRIYFLVPFTLEIPFGAEELPMSIGATVAPGLQLAIPSVDHAFEDFSAFSGRFIDEDSFAAFNLRAAVAFRAPLSYSLRFFIEGAYDWAVGEADVTVRNTFGSVIERRSGDIDLSALQVMLGFSLVF